MRKGECAKDLRTSLPFAWFFYVRCSVSWTVKNQVHPAPRGFAASGATVCYARPATEQHAGRKAYVLVRVVGRTDSPKSTYDQGREKKRRLRLDQICIGMERKLIAAATTLRSFVY